MRPRVAGCVSVLIALYPVLVRAKAFDAAQPAPKFHPSMARLLSEGSPTKDEDPTVLRTPDGTMIVAWFSDRGGNSDIYLRSTLDGKLWSDTTRVTDDPGGDFDPSLLLDSRGTFHLVWFRWTAPSVGHIWHSTSTDGLTWNKDDEEQVTTGDDYDDWVPTIAEAPDGTLLIYFVSLKRSNNGSSELYVVSKRAGESDWGPVAPVTDINSVNLHDHLPAAVLTGDHLTLTWVRYDTANELPWKSPASELFTATSSDGLHWTSPAQLTSSARQSVNLFPQYYQRFDGRWFVIWLSTRAGTPSVYEFPIARAAMFPAGLVRNKRLRPGYSHHVAATPTQGIYLGAWVEGEEGVQDIYTRFFKRP